MIRGQQISITGTTRGIGRSLCEKLSVHNSVQQMNRPQYDLENISSMSQIDFSSTDCLILNASDPWKSSDKTNGKIVDTDFSDLARMIQVNLIGNLYLIQQYVKQRSQGTVVIITSRLAHETTDSACVYSITKTALSKLVANLRLEYPTLRFVEIAPSRTRETDQDSNIFKKVSSYDQVADAIVYTLYNTKIDFIRL
jgi:short-subunit dehydrogenase